ncbi:MAG TPA: hypothetical protein VHT75_05250 [Acidimicrobiales bacterium]|nr:hypothetical protein [Acidimicrobiales bacterium]
MNVIGSTPAGAGPTPPTRRVGQLGAVLAGPGALLARLDGRSGRRGSSASG